MLLPLHAVDEVCGTPLAGIRSMRLIDPDDLQAQPVWYFPGLVSDIVFKPGRAAYAFPLEGLKASLTDDTLSDEQGDRYEYDLQGFTKGVTPSMELLRQKLRGRRVHLEFTYGDGQRRLLPNIRLKMRGKSGNRGGNRQGYDVSGRLQLSRPAPFSEATFPIIGPPYEPPTGGGGSGGSTIVTETTSGSTHTYNVPSGSLLVCIEVVAGGSSMFPSIGFSPGAGDIGGPVDLAAGMTWVCAGLQVPSAPSTPIYFSGLAGTNTIRLWLLNA